MYLNCFFDLQIRCLMSSIYGKAPFPRTSPIIDHAFSSLRYTVILKKAGRHLVFPAGFTYPFLNTFFVRKS